MSKTYLPDCPEMKMRIKNNKYPRNLLLKRRLVLRRMPTELLAMGDEFQASFPRGSCNAGCDLSSGCSGVRAGESGPEQHSHARLLREKEADR